MVGGTGGGGAARGEMRCGASGGAGRAAQSERGGDGIVGDWGRSGGGAECGRAESSGAVGGGGGGYGCAVEDGRGGFGGCECGAGKREVSAAASVSLPDHSVSDASAYGAGTR